MLVQSSQNEVSGRLEPEGSWVPVSFLAENPGQLPQLLNCTMYRIPQEKDLQATVLVFSHQ